MSRPSPPPFALDTAVQEGMAEDAWNTCDPVHVAWGLYARLPLFFREQRLRPAAHAGARSADRIQRPVRLILVVAPSRHPTPHPPYAGQK